MLKQRVGRVLKQRVEILPQNSYNSFISSFVLTVHSRLGFVRVGFLSNCTKPEYFVYFEAEAIEAVQNKIRFV